MAKMDQLSLPRCVAALSGRGHLVTPRFLTLDNLRHVTPSLPRSTLVITELVSCRAVLVQGPTTQAFGDVGRSLNVGSDDVFSKELGNQARAQRQREQQRCDQELPLFMAASRFTQRLLRRVVDQVERTRDEGGL